VVVCLLQVLRFFGYFQEAVIESNIENHRIRKVVFMYYLADDSVQVTEPKQDNSGIPQVQSAGANAKICRGIKQLGTAVFKRKTYFDIHLHISPWFSKQQPNLCLLNSEINSVLPPTRHAYAAGQGKP
jgi:hypothetical protein